MVNRGVQRRLSRTVVPLVGLIFTGGLLQTATATTSVKAGAEAVPESRLSEEDRTFFESRVRPLLAKHCYACHSGKTKILQGGLRLDSRAALLKGGDTGPAIVPGEPDKSPLIEAVRFTRPGFQMPPAGKMREAEIATLVEWVRRGAPWPGDPAETKGTAPRPSGMTLEKGKQFWSLRPLRKSETPPVKLKGWGSRRIDTYLLARLEKDGLRPSPPADRRTLIRRASFDLTGLPPTPEEVEAFVADRRPDAYAALVDRLLASPHYGERWGRHWLDLVRYCDVPESWAQTEAQPWLYRDWVVDALNQDLPYDQFVKRQFAADLMRGTTPKDIAALGYLGLSPSYWKELKLAPDVIKTVVAEEWEERVHTITGSLLGLTVACARCHDHKFDPVSQKDYYGLAGVLANTRLVSRPLLPPDQAEAVMKSRKEVAALEAQAKQLQQMAGKEKSKATELKAKAATLQERVAEIKRTTPGFDAPTAYAVDDAALQVLPDGPDRTKLVYQEGSAWDVPLQLRGDPAKAGAVVPRQFLAVLSPGVPPRFTQGSGRLDFAEAVFREGAPLAARVMVNRVWRHHFGKGLVETPSNFGVQGDRPSHPELLDDLAARFIRAGWSLKWLHREILLSSAYRQVSAPPLDARVTRAQSLDPENRLLWRMNRLRLEVEAWRDGILRASGNLDLKLGGAPQELSAPQNVRRTLYGVVKRRELDDLLRLYDFPDPTTHSPARFPTTTPLQQLYVLNGAFIGRQAEALLARLRKEVPEDRDGQVRRAHHLLYGRPPSEVELKAARNFLAGDAVTPPNDETWRQYLEVLLARNEMMFLN